MTTNLSVEFPVEIAYADDVDFIDTNNIYLEKILEIGTEVLSGWDLKVNTAKTEWIHLILAEDPNQRGQEKWRSIKSLGSLLGNTQDISLRKQLAAAAYRTLMTVWC